MQDRARDRGKEPETAELAARMAIHEVLAVHCRGVDRADERALKSAYWPDAEVAYGGFEGLAHEFCEMLPKSIVRFAHTQHSISNVLIEFFDGARAKMADLEGAQTETSWAAVETYVTAYHYLGGENGAPDTEMTFLGRYLDRFERRGSVWKINHRRVLMDWNQNADSSAVLEGPPFDGLARGTRYPSDPVYALLRSTEDRAR